MIREEQMVLKYREVLTRSERFRPAELEAYQQSLLDPLLQHAHRNVPFYRDRLAPVFHNSEADLSRWTEIPTLTRAEAMRNVESLRASAVPPHAGKIFKDETSGSTGIPLPHLKNDLVEVAALAMTDRMYRWWDFDGNRTLASFLSPYKELAPPPHGAEDRNWRPGYPKGVHYMLGMGADTDTQLDWLAARRPDYLIAISSTLLPLAERAAERGIDLRFDRIVSRAGILSNDVRQRCKKQFCAAVIDQYGAQEIGFISCECPVCGEHHVAAEGVKVEILDADDRPCRPGQTGRVVITSLYNYAMPFIRYEIGDFAEVGTGRSKCHIRLPRLVRILGRYRNMLTLRDGRIIYPSLHIGRFRDYLSFAQLQFIQTDYDVLEIHYVPGAPEKKPDKDGLEAYVRQEIDSSLRIELRAVEKIDRLPSGKFEDFVSLVSRKPGQP